MCYLVWATLHGFSTAALTSNPLLAVWAAHLVSHLSGGGVGLGWLSGRLWRGPSASLAGSHGRTFAFGGGSATGPHRTSCSESEWAPPRLVSEATSKKPLIRKSREDYITRAQTEQWETVFKKESAPIWSGDRGAPPLPVGLTELRVGARL